MELRTAQHFAKYWRAASSTSPMNHCRYSGRNESMFADGATPYGDHAPGGFVCSEERGGCLGVECSARVQNRRPGKPAAERRSPRPKTQWKIRGENPGLDGKPWIEKAIRSGGRGMEVALTNRRGGELDFTVPLPPSLPAVPTKLKAIWRAWRRIDRARPSTPAKRQLSCNFFRIRPEHFYRRM